MDGERMRDGRLSLQATGRRIGLDPQQFWSGRQRVSAGVVRGVLEHLDLPEVERQSRVCWQEIIGIEAAGVERVFDITVEGIHNFVANGVIAHNCLYQEQYMEIAKALAGFTPAEADDLRKAIGKKIHSLMASLREKFTDGCLANGVTPAVAKQLWEDT